MIDWQFFIQKEGCWFWEAIERSQITIEAGRYRVIAEANSLKNCDVEINCTYDDREVAESNNLLFKRFCRFNSAGLIMVIPFTYFRAGCWQFSCESDFFTAILGDFWRESLQLQVLPIPQSDRQVKQEKLELKLQLKNSKIGSFFQLKSINNIFDRGDLFGCNTAYFNKLEKARLLELESILPRKEALLLRKETLATLAGVTLNIINFKRYNELLQIFKKPRDRQCEAIARTKIERLPFKLNLLETEQMPELPKIFSAPRQVLPQKIERFSLNKIGPKSPQLPKINPALPIPNFNINKPTSFKINRPIAQNDKSQKLAIYPLKELNQKPAFLNNSQRYTNNNIERVDRDFQALKLKERFWSRLNSLANNPQ